MTVINQYEPRFTLTLVGIFTAYYILCRPTSIDFAFKVLSVPLSVLFMLCVLRRSDAHLTPSDNYYFISFWVASHNVHTIVSGFVMFRTLLTLGWTYVDNRKVKVDELRKTSFIATTCILWAFSLWIALYDLKLITLGLLVIYALLYWIYYGLNFLVVIAVIILWPLSLWMGSQVNLNFITVGLSLICGPFLLYWIYTDSIKVEADKLRNSSDIANLLAVFAAIYAVLLRAFFRTSSHVVFGNHIGGLEFGDFIVQLIIFIGVKLAWPEGIEQNEPNRAQHLDLSI
ncbi:uncharacterized protein K444DRAFT_617776 [Hyaloscypha bicolor E]|uniref:Uncharacterized protein n=1 Tax=Hyaloscypha bicolor E TaxID=1095630 RepID=A0A2J6SX29_9HELO|nr:uncharacterized protein K444DRAFT_617776 [Hyaloscypha bicolor E]PMD55322.1 hypothetical protein K444DRAFT_617776 [Hyaloscypha bicolor E]